MWLRYWSKKADMIFANVIAFTHAIADGVGNIVPQHSFDSDLTLKFQSQQFICGKFFRFTEKQPRIIFEPIFAATRYVIPAALWISTWLCSKLNLGTDIVTAEGPTVIKAGAPVVFTAPFSRLRMPHSGNKLR
jgi:hypothetical protein